MIRWIFVDFGNVLFIDEPLLEHTWEEIYRTIRNNGEKVSFAELMRLREERVLAHQDSAPHATVGALLLGAVGWERVRGKVAEDFRQDYFAFNFLIRGAEEVLARLSVRYSLAVVANQPQVFRQALQKVDLEKFFEVIGISGERGLSKPSPAFFRAMLEEAGCAPKEAIMVGDRIDNDIEPAQRLGMRTIWFNLKPEVQGYAAKTELERLYVESLQRVPSRGSGHPEEEIEPDITVTELRQLVPAVEEIAAKARIR